MTGPSEIVATRFKEAGVAAGRFVAVKDGGKMCVDHNTRYDSPNDVPGENYGIYADEADQLVVLDVDYHREGSEDLSPVALAALSALPRTLKIQSPHVPDGDRGGHRIYKLAGDETPADLFKRRFGKQNPVATWGEVVSKNKYVVAPGSQLDGCTKEWCDKCETTDGGRYSIKKDREIAEVDPETLVGALAADDDLEDVEKAETSSSTATPIPAENVDETFASGEHDEFDRETVEEMLEAVPGTQHFDDWIRTGYAVYDWDSGARGKSVFEAWSRSNSKWEDGESQRQIDYIWENGEPGDSSKNTSIGTLVYLAQENGWSPSPLSPKELVVKYSDNYDDPANVPDSLIPESRREADGADGGETDESPDEARAKELAAATAGDSSAEDVDVDWGDVRTLYDLAQDDKSFSKGSGRQRAADVLESETSWMYVLESERLWVYRAEAGVYDRFGEAEAANILVDELGEHYSRSERSEIIGQLQDRNQTHREELNARGHDAPLVCVGNGVINLETGDLMDHSPRFRFVRGLQWDYAPEDAAPNRIVEFLDDVTERVADRDTLLDHLAHGLMPGHPFRAFVVAYGPGGNGKTQVAELFREFVGDENSAAVEIDELADDDYATGDLPGKFLNWGDDMAGDGGGTLQELSLLKKASGGSKIRANEKYEKTFDFMNEAALFFSANEPPRIGERKQSIQDRIYPIEMPYRFVSDPDPDNPMEKEKETNVSEKLITDASAMRGLLALAVEHAQELLDSRGEYSQPESPEERLKKYNQSADPIVRFAGKALEQSDGDSLIRKDDVYRVYRSFVSSWEERVASERGFKRQLPKAFSGDIENGRSRGLATPDDEKDRVVCWKRLSWTETALAEMPDWMAERYSDHFEDAPAATDADASADDEPASSPAPLETVEDAYGGAGTLSVEVTITEEFEPAPWLQAEGTVTDDCRELDFQARGDANPLPADAVGETYRVHNVRLTTGEFDETMLEFRPDTKFVPVSPGAKAAAQQSVSDAVTDGGDGDDQAGAEDAPTSAKGQVLAALRETSKDALTRGALVETATEQFDDLGPDAASEAIDSALEQNALVARAVDDKLEFGSAGR